MYARTFLDKLGSLFQYLFWHCFNINFYFLQEFSYKPGDWLVFGSETSGLPPDALFDCRSEAYGGGTIKIPMVDTYVRCLNLSVSVGIAVYEAARQLDYEQLQYSSESLIKGENQFIAEDIFA